jgi:hypothetical protein
MWYYMYAFLFTGISKVFYVKSVISNGIIGNVTIVSIISIGMLSKLIINNFILCIVVIVIEWYLTGAIFVQSDIWLEQ